MGLRVAGEGTMCPKSWTQANICLRPCLPNKQRALHNSGTRARNEGLTERVITLGFLFRPAGPTEPGPQTLQRSLLHLLIASEDGERMREAKPKSSSGPTLCWKDCYHVCEDSPEGGLHECASRRLSPVVSSTVGLPTAMALIGPVTV